MQPRLIDTHCHLDMAPFDKDLNRVIESAKKAGIEYIINIGSDREANKKCLKISGEYSDVYVSVGIHPHNALSLNDGLYSELTAWIKQPKVVAIGEIGLDYHYMHSPKEVQIDAFKKQISLARTSGLPVIVHSREAMEDTLQIIQREASGISGVLHCFSGDVDMVKRAIDLGFYISIAGPVTFKNAEELRTVTAFIPDERLLIETDAPYLSPVPKRGKRNEPAFLIHTAQVIADVRGVTLSDIARITTLNAMKLFKIGAISDKGEIAYRIRDSLYLNITNRCTNKCGFCVKFHTSFVKGHNLHLEKEPSTEEVIRSIGDPALFKEIVFCGIGEPMMRLDVVKDVSSWIKQKGGKVRINTNGHGNLINKRNVLPELKGLVDSISISLDADNADAYETTCKPTFKNSFEGVLAFIKEAKQNIPDVKITVVDVPEINIERCRQIAEELGVELRVREYNIVG